MLENLESIDRLEKRLNRHLPLPASSSDSASSDRELLAKFAKRYSNDYVGFTRLLAIDSRRGRIPFELSPIQLAYHAARTPRDVDLKARRVGMTTEALARDVWAWLTQDGSAVAVVCQAGNNHQALNAIHNIVDPFVEQLVARGLPLKFETRTKTHWKLEDGRVFDFLEAGASDAAAEKVGRAARYTRLHLTEMSSWEYAGKTMAALRYCVAGPEFGTEIQIESTAKGAASDDRDSQLEASGASMFHWYVQDAQRGTNGYRLHFFPWYQDPENVAPLEPGEQVVPRSLRERNLLTLGVTAEQLKWYQKQVDEVRNQDQIDQELASDPITCFLVSGRTYFDKARTAELLALAREPVFTHSIHEPGAFGPVISGQEIPAIRAWHLPEPGKLYIVVCDTSEGDGGDAACALVFERGTGKHCATLWGQFKPWELAKHAVQVAKDYNGALIVVERNNDGKTVLRAIDAEQHYHHVFVDADGKPGWLTTEPSRSMALTTLEKAYRDKTFSTNDKYLLGEARTFIVNKRGKAEAAKGAHDDLIMGSAIGWDVLCRPVAVDSSVGTMPVA
jgi:hypothetical protein